jgi:Bax protein
VTSADELAYDLEAVRRGHPVPYLVAPEIPDDITEIAYSEGKKDAFFKLVLPLVLSVNDDIKITRAYLLKLNAMVARGRPLSAKQKSWLRRLATYYKVEPGEDGILDLGALIPRVDVVPVSIALAQAAEESGWGVQSRFTAEGNALFMELTRNAAEGMATNARELAGTGYRVRAFDSLRASTSSYMRNINTHPAYRPFRALREAYRIRHLPLDPYALVETLEPYCGCGPDYVTRLKRIMKSNRLSDFDDALLAEPGTLRQTGDPEH